MRISKLAVMGLVAGAGAVIVVGCGSSDFNSCADTKTCGSAGAAGSTEGGSTGGSGGTSGSAGMDAGQSGAAGASGMAGGDAGEAEAAPVPDPLGAACTDGSTCDSTLCVDGVCCDSACDGTCEGCDQTGHAGTCRPIASGSDPDKECLGSASAGAACAGSCDGSGACSFPGGAVPCAASTCTSGTQTNHFCGGDGACNASTKDCGKYVCSASTCKTFCSLDSDCAAGTWCNSGSCEDKHADGAQCLANNQCAKGHCIDQICCATTCGAPDSCSTGQCLCGGVACTSGHACIVWHYDQDNDAHAGISATYDKAACDNTKPPAVNGRNFFASADDCDDGNPSAYPGQTAYFTTDRGDGSFDFDCSGSTELQYGVRLPSSQCIDCGALTATLPSTCGVCGTTGFGGLKGYHMGFACGSGCGQVTTQSLFGAGTACGQSGTLYSCPTTTCGTTQTSTANVKQGCH